MGLSLDWKSHWGYKLNRLESHSVGPRWFTNKCNIKYMMLN